MGNVKYSLGEKDFRVSRKTFGISIYSTYWFSSCHHQNRTLICLRDFFLAPRSLTLEAVFRIVFLQPRSLNDFDVMTAAEAGASPRAYVNQSRTSKNPN